MHEHRFGALGHGCSSVVYVTTVLWQTLDGYSRREMLDTLTILFSTICVLFVVVRAIKLDRDLPWFPRPSPPEGIKAAQPRAGAFRRVARHK